MGPVHEPSGGDGTIKLRKGSCTYEGGGNCGTPGAGSDTNEDGVIDVNWGTTALDPESQDFDQIKRAYFIGSEGSGFLVDTVREILDTLKKF